MKLSTLVKAHLRVVSQYSKAIERLVKVSREGQYLYLRLTTLLKRKALPVAPVKRVEISSARLVRNVSHWAQEKIRDPPKCSR